MPHRPRPMTAAIPIAVIPIAVIPIAAVVVAAGGAGVAVWARAGGTADRAGGIALAVTILLIALAGCVMALARPDNRVGWIVVAAGAAWGAGEGAFDAGVRGTLVLPGRVPGATALVVAGAAVRAIGWFGAAVAVPVVFPDGRLPGPRWRWLGIVATAGIAATFLGTLLDAHVENSALAAAGWHNPLPAGLGGVGNLLSTLSLPLMAETVVGSVVGMVHRFRHGDVRMRRQVLVFAAGVVAISFAPLRAALQDAANRITYGRWRTPYEVLAGLGSRIEGAADTGRALADVVNELYVTLGLTGAALRDPAGAILAGTPGADPVVVPLTAYGRRAGDLLYSEPATPLRPGDRRVLDDLAAQLALLMHARSLTDDLQRARERLVLAREEERRRLRRDLHDGLGPALAGLMLKVDNARALVGEDPPAAARDLVTLRDDIAGTVLDVRRLVEGLRPPAIDELGLGPALTQAVNRLAARPGLALDVTFDDDLPALPAAVEVAVYRVVSEAVTNVVRHATATTCAVRVSYRDRTLYAEVRDDGVGLRAPGPGGHGLATMRERAEELGGTLTVRSDGAGTSVTAMLPAAA